MRLIVRANSVTRSVLDDVIDWKVNEDSRILWVRTRTGRFVFNRDGWLSVEQQASEEES